MMLDTIIVLLSFYGLTYLIKEADILSPVRNWLMMKSTFITKMLFCWFCTGFHAGWMVYLLHMDHFNAATLFLYALAGAASASIINAIVNRLTWTKDE